MWPVRALRRALRPRRRATVPPSRRAAAEVRALLRVAPLALLLDVGHGLVEVFGEALCRHDPRAWSGLGRYVVRVLGSGRYVVRVRAWVRVKGQGQGSG